MHWSPILWSDTRANTFRPEELRQLRQLRDQYRSQPDVFSSSELDKLRFVRWMVSTGRVHTG